MKSLKANHNKLSDAHEQMVVLEHKADVAISEGRELVFGRGG